MCTCVGRNAQKGVMYVQSYRVKLCLQHTWKQLSLLRTCCDLKAQEPPSGLSVL